MPLSRSADLDLNLAQPLVLAVTCAVGWAADSAGILLPGTALLLAVPLCLAACALALLRPRPSEAPAAAAASAADGSATTTAPAGSGSVR